MKKVILEEIENMKYLLGYKRGVVISEQQAGNQKFNFNDNPALTQGGINYTPTAPADMFKNAQAAVAGATTQATGAPAAQQKFNFNPNPNITPESGINFKPQTPQEMAKGVASATPTTGAPAATTQAAPVTPIKIGVKYPDIETLQNLLKTKFQAVLTPDGKYGPKTAASVLAALQKASTNTPQTNTPETNTPPNIVVGGDASSEAIKKAAEANAPTNVAANNTNNNTNKNTQQPAGGTNFTDVDVSEFS
jgi:hypothetical protein